MRLRFVNQPVRELLGDELLSLLRSPDTWRFWAASAWVRRPALRRLAPDLGAFASRVQAADCRGLFGVDLGGTTREGLELAAQLFGQTRVFHSSGRPGRTFHPKLYLFEQADLAVVAIGSANLTTGGLWGNFEATTIIELDPNQAADAEFLADVRTWYERWWSDPDGSRPASGATIDALEADVGIDLPREHEVRTILARSRPTGGTPRRAFPTAVTGLKRIPKAPLDVDEAAERDEQPTIVVPGLALDEIKTAAHKDDLRVLVAGVPLPGTRLGSTETSRRTSFMSMSTATRFGLKAFARMGRLDCPGKQSSCSRVIQTGTIGSNSLSPTIVAIQDRAGSLSSCSSVRSGRSDT